MFAGISIMHAFIRFIMVRSFATGGYERQAAKDGKC